jgi:hypothetical protein
VDLLWLGKLGWETDVDLLWDALWSMDTWRRLGLDEYSRRGTTLWRGFVRHKGKRLGFYRQ